MLQIITDMQKDIEARYLLNHSSFVDVRHKILYVETPKVACTSIKYMLRSLVPAKPVRFVPYEGHTTPSQRIHTRDEMPLPPLGSFTPERIQEILSDPAWFRFCVVRHPYDRFFSAWRDKIFLTEPTYEEHQLDKTKKFVEFNDFVEKVLREDPRRCDVHWRLQVSLLQPDQINYTHIYDLPQVTELLADLQLHLAGMGMIDASLTLPRNNESWSITPAGFLTSGITARLRDYYQLDFERFNFPERPATTSAAITAASLVNEYTDAIYDRNRIIMEHVQYAIEQRKRGPGRILRFLRRKFRRSGVGIRLQSLLRTPSSKVT